VNTEHNQNTQPLTQHRVFNNWNVVTNGWYIAAKIKDIKVNKIFSVVVCGQKIVFFRDSKSVVHCMDGYCPHMGVDLAIGKIVDDKLRCFFHHWEFDTNGRCVKIPAQKEIPKRACLKTYATCEKYGFVWVYPNESCEQPILEIPGLEGSEVHHSIGKSFYRNCHHHITMINGIDPQHLRTVHSLDIDMNLQIDNNEASTINIELSGELPETTLIEKMVKKVIGPKYAYSMKYADGCLGALTLMKDVCFFGRLGVIPRMYVLFAYRPIEEGKTFVQPIFITKKRKGITGYIVSTFLLMATKRGFLSLQGEDGEVYNNIRFNTNNLLPIDSPITKYIGYINRLSPSIWSRKISSSDK
jgi:nitrite reductase/ring-hydroxylating ferredoxin subunit